MTQEQKIRISERIATIADANKEILEVVQEMEEDKEMIPFIKATEKIGNGAYELLKEIQ